MNAPQRSSRICLFFLLALLTLVVVFFTAPNFSNTAPSAEPEPSCVPICIPDGDGSWEGMNPPLRWKASLGPPLCVHAVASIEDALRLFAGQRLVFSGDSVSRNEITDFVNLVYDCGLYMIGAGIRSKVLAFPEDAPRWTLNGTISTTFLEERNKMCELVRASHKWGSTSFVLRHPGHNWAPLTVEFEWEPYFEKLPNSKWYKALLSNYSNVRAVITGAYAWIGFQFAAPGDPVYNSSERLLEAQRRFAAVMASSPLRDAIYHRTSPVMERGMNAFPLHDPRSMVTTDRSLRIFEDLAAVWREDYPWTPVINMLGFSRASICADAMPGFDLGNGPSYRVPGAFCRAYPNKTFNGHQPSAARLLTYDGHHPESWTSLPRMQATLNAIAAHSCRRGPPPGCDILC
jgi:hypothetical protein